MKHDFWIEKKCRHGVWDFGNKRTKFLQNKKKKIKEIDFWFCNLICKMLAIIKLLLLINQMSLIDVNVNHY